SSGLRNDGINISAPRGTPVRAAEGGIVAYAGNELRGFGNLILVRHADGWVTAYAHTEDILVRRGERVERGQEIARVGRSGGVADPQLHFEIRKGGEPVDPIAHLAERRA
ncbi:MAG: M23 family metallopeptidase, partial [Alphaproteobacteria bacterium]|nr:M23 family metallopeptidase [Alphaproteobacteria bacterium]